MVASLQLPKPEPVTTQLRPFSDPHWCVPEAEKRCIWASCRSLFRSLPEAGGPERIATVARLAIAQAGDRGERLSEIVMIYLLVSKPRSKPVRPPFVPTRRRRRELRPVRDRPEFPAAAASGNEWWPHRLGPRLRYQEVNHDDFAQAFAPIPRLRDRQSCHGGDPFRAAGLGQGPEQGPATGPDAALLGFGNAPMRVGEGPQLCRYRLRLR